MKIMNLEDNLRHFKQQVDNEKHESFMLKFKLGMLQKFSTTLPENGAKVEKVEELFTCQLCGEKMDLSRGYTKCSYDEYTSFCIPIPNDEALMNQYGQEQPIHTFAAEQQIVVHQQDMGTLGEEYLPSLEQEHTVIIYQSLKPNAMDSRAGHS